jgi:exodeoxyribonuclease VII small subunit
VVDQLETGSPDLESALALVDDGTRLAATCSQLLDNAELRVTRLTPESASPIPEPSSET